MPLRKADYKKKRKYRNKKNNYMSLTRRVSNIESEIRAEETKKKFTTFNEITIPFQSSSLPVWTLINEILPGDTGNSLDGVSYINRGIGYKFLLHNTSGEPCVFRMAILRLKSGQTFSSTGEDLFTGTQSLGISYASTTERQRYYYPFNRKKFDVILEEHVKIGAKNSVGDDQFNANQLIKGYKAFKNRKEFIDSSVGNMNTNYYMIGFAVPAALDLNTGNIELTGETTLYFKDK